MLLSASGVSGAKLMLTLKTQSRTVAKKKDR